MTVKNLLKLHYAGIARVSILQMPYDMRKHRYSHTYFSEEYQEDILSNQGFKSIAGKQVDHFNVIGGDMYNVELCIYIEEERNND